MTPKETSVWWIEYILANGNELTKSPATNLSWFAYHSIDVILFLVSIFGAVVYAIIRLLKLWINRAKSCQIDNKKRD